MMFIVMPKNAYCIRSIRSFKVFVGKAAFFPRYIVRNTDPRKNLQNARVKGGILVRLTLNTGAAAPQMMLDAIIAKNAFWAVVIFIVKLLNCYIV